MQLREATESDFEEIIRLMPTREELFYVYPKGRHPLTVDQLRFLAEDRKEMTVAVENAEVIGFANLYNVRPYQSAFIGNVVVSHRLRGQGIGRRLVSHMMRKAFDRYAVEQVRISVFNDNTSALLLYASMQFQPYAVEEGVGPAGNRLGLIHMKLHRSLRAG